jgi:SNF2 family DNA or RNA helicase
VLLTGTPLQNDLGELRALLQLLDPVRLGDEVRGARRL